MFAMLESPEVFQQYVIISPSMWWDCSDDSVVCRQDTTAPDGWILRREAELAAQGNSLSGRVFLTVGNLENPIMVEGSRRLAARFGERGYEGFEWTFEMAPGEWHMSIVPGAISDGLRWLHFGDG